MGVGQKGDLQPENDSGKRGTATVRRFITRWRASQIGYPANAVTAVTPRTCPMNLRRDTTCIRSDTIKQNAALARFE